MELWAGALYKLDAGATAQLPRELMAEQEVINEDHRHRNHILEDAVFNLEPSRDRLSVLMTRADVQGVHQRQFVELLRKEGWEQKTWRNDDGKQIRGWQHPDYNRTQHHNLDRPF